MPNIDNFWSTFDDRYMRRPVPAGMPATSPQSTPDRTLEQLGVGRPYDKPNPSELFNHDFRAGIEIEVEGLPEVDSAPAHWNIISDGSLRNYGREFVTKNGFSGKALEKALDTMDTWFKDHEVSLSERCSTHIHIDVRDMTPRQVVNFMCLGVMVEHVLFNLFGNTRTANMFCISTDCGTTNMYNIIASLVDPETLIRNNWSKYSAIGLKRLTDLGTVEFRMFKTLLTKEEYVRVLNVLFAMKAHAMERDSPQQLVDVKLTQGMSTIFQMYIPDIAYSPEYDLLLDRGAETLNDIITAAEVVRISSERAKKYKTIIKQADRLMREAQQGI